MGYVGTSHITSGYDTLQAEQNAPDHKSSMDKDDFLKLLVAQLNHQDPLNPMEDTEMTGQLAEYSSLEQLTNLNTSMDALLEQNTNNELYTAVSFIGKTVKAEGYNISKTGDVTSTVHYSLGEAVANVTVNIYSPEGDIVRTEIIGSKQPGVYEYVWDGKNENGETMADGVYSIGMIGEDSEGEQVMVKTDVSGVVSGVVSENGKHYLKLEDGRYMDFAFVTEVVAPDEAGEAADTTDTTDES